MYLLLISLSVKSNDFPRFCTRIVELSNDIQNIKDIGDNGGCQLILQELKKLTDPKPPSASADVIEQALRYCEIVLKIPTQ